MPIYVTSGRRSAIPDHYRRMSSITNLVSRLSLKYRSKGNISLLEKKQSSPHPNKINLEQEQKATNDSLNRRSFRILFCGMGLRSSINRKMASLRYNHAHGEANKKIDTSSKPNKDNKVDIRKPNRKSEYQQRANIVSEKNNSIRLSTLVKRTMNAHNASFTDNVPFSTGSETRRLVQENRVNDLALLCQLYLINTVVQKPDVEDINLSEEFNYQLDERYFVYYPQIFRYLCDRETLNVVSGNFLVHNKIEPDFRCILIDWLFKVQLYSNLRTESLQVAVCLIDLFTSKALIRRSYYQLVGIAALLIACKVVQRFHPKIKHLCYLTDDCYKPHHVLQMEVIILEKLDFFVNVPIPSHFHHRGLLACVEILNTEEMDSFCNFMFDLIMLDPTCSSLRPSYKAAGAILLGRYILYSEYSTWTKILHHYTLYGVAQLKQCVKAYVQMLVNVYDNPEYRFKTVVNKYAKRSLGAISSNVSVMEFSQSVESQEKLERLFD